MPEGIEGFICCVAVYLRFIEMMKGMMIYGIN